MQRVGEEMGQLRLDNEALDNVVPAKVIHLFAENFANGFVGMMTKLGFNYENVPSPPLSASFTIAPKPLVQDDESQDDSESSSDDEEPPPPQQQQPRIPSFSVGSIMMSKLKL
jgi:hypothetical protein